MRALPALCVLLSVAVASACQTTAGVPCFTLTYEQSVWALVKSPARDMLSAELTGSLALRADGATALRIKPLNRYAVRGSAPALQGFARVTPPGGGAPVQRGEDPQTDFYFHPQIAAGRAGGAADRCRAVVVASLGPQPPEWLGEGRHLEEPVVKWRVRKPYGEATVALAPALDCQVLTREAVEYRYKYLPVRKEVFTVKSIQKGAAPAAELFWVK